MIKNQVMFVVEIGFYYTGADMDFPEYLGDQTVKGLLMELYGVILFVSQSCLQARNLSRKDEERHRQKH